MKKPGYTEIKEERDSMHWCVKDKKNLGRLDEKYAK
jgi:hypothetical protein